MDLSYSKGDVVTLTDKGIAFAAIENPSLLNYNEFRIGEIDIHDDNLPYRIEALNNTEEELWVRAGDIGLFIQSLDNPNKKTKDQSPELCPQAHDQKEYCGEKVMDAVRLLCKGH